MTQHHDRPADPASLQGGQDSPVTIPLLQETLEVGKRSIDTGRGVRVHKSISERTEQVDITLLQDELTIEHIPIDRLISPESAPVARYEGATLVVPVLEEVLQVHKQLRLKEEVRITRRARPQRHTQSVTLRSESVRVERFQENPEDPSAADGHPT